MEGTTRGTSALKIVCWAQVLMVIANLGRIPVVSTDDRTIPITINELCLAAIVGTGLLVMLQRRFAELDRVAVAALVFVCIGGGSAVWSVSRLGLTPFELAVSLAYLARWVMYFGVYLTVVNIVRGQGVEDLWRAVETMLVLLAAFGIIQSAFLPNFAQMIYPESREYIDWDPQGHRLVSTVLDPNIAGSMLMIGLLVQLGRITAGAHVGRARLAIVAVGLVLTISRSAAIGTMFGIMVVLAARGLSKRLARVAVVAGVLLLLASPLLLQYALAYNKFDIGEGTSAGARLTNWLIVLKIISEYPLFGVGFNAYKFAASEYGATTIGPSSYGADGGLLFITALTGIVGIFAYCSMLGLVILRCRSIWRDGSLAPGDRGLAIGTAAGTIGVVISSFFVNAILTTFVMEMLWVLWGITYVVARARRDRRLGHPPVPHAVVALAA
jgi:hypothetical protein